MDATNRPSAYFEIAQCGKYVINAKNIYEHHLGLTDADIARLIDSPTDFDRQMMADIYNFGGCIYEAMYVTLVFNRHGSVRGEEILGQLNWNSFDRGTAALTAHALNQNVSLHELERMHQEMQAENRRRALAASMVNAGYALGAWNIHGAGAAQGNQVSGMAQGNQRPNQGPIEMNLQFFGNKGRGANNLSPDPFASGAHTTFRKDPVTGKITNYQTWNPNPRNPSGFDAGVRFDARGKPHYNTRIGENIDTPHVHDKSTPGGVRPAHPWEVPGR